MKKIKIKIKYLLNLGIINFSLAAKVLIQMIKIITPPKKTKTNKYINQLIFILNNNNPVLREIIIKNILKVIGWVTESII